MIVPATEEHFAGLSVPRTPGVETWGFVLEDGDTVKGAVFVSEAMGQAFGHDTFVVSEDPADALRLWRRARQELKGRGFERCMVHVETGTNPRLVDFWEGVGFKPRMVIYEGEL